MSDGEILEFRYSSVLLMWLFPLACTGFSEFLKDPADAMYDQESLGVQDSELADCLTLRVLRGKMPAD